MKRTKNEYIAALQELHGNHESKAFLSGLIEKHFTLIEHMKMTSLFDVLVYEERVTKACMEPMSILKFENERLKKEVNKLRKQLGLIEKYREGV